MSPIAVHFQLPSGAAVAGTLAIGETPTPATDGAQLVFTVANEYEVGTLEVMVGGITQVAGVDFSETTTTTFTMTYTIDVDEKLRVNYVKA